MQFGSRCILVTIHNIPIFQVIKNVRECALFFLKLKKNRSLRCLAYSCRRIVGTAEGKICVKYCSSAICSFLIMETKPMLESAPWFIHVLTRTSILPRYLVLIKHLYYLSRSHRCQVSVPISCHWIPLPWKEEIAWRTEKGNIPLFLYVTPGHTGRSWPLIVRFLFCKNLDDPYACYD